MTNEEMIARLERYRAELQEGLKTIPNGEIDFDTFYGIQVDGHWFDYNIYDASKGYQGDWKALVYCVEDEEILYAECMYLSMEGIQRFQFSEEVLNQSELNLEGSIKKGQPQKGVLMKYKQEEITLAEIAVELAWQWPDESVDEEGPRAEARWKRSEAACQIFNSGLITKNTLDIDEVISNWLTKTE